MNSKIAIIGNGHESALLMALINSFEQNVVVDNVKEALLKRDCDSTLLISKIDIDPLPFISKKEDERVRRNSLMKNFKKIRRKNNEK